MIKKITFLSLLFILSSNIKAGGVRVDSAVDFTAIDIHGVEHNLFSYR